MVWGPPLMDDVQFREGLDDAQWDEALVRLGGHPLQSSHWGRAASRRTVGGLLASQDTSSASRFGWPGRKFGLCRCSAGWHGYREADDITEGVKRRDRRRDGANISIGILHLCVQSVAQGARRRRWVRWTAHDLDRSNTGAGAFVGGLAEEVASRCGVCRACRRGGCRNARRQALGRVFWVVPIDQSGERIFAARVRALDAASARVTSGQAGFIAPFHRDLRRPPRRWCVHHPVWSARSLLLGRDRSGSF